LEGVSGIGRGIGLLGLRFGATLAALAAERSPKVGKLVLWEPIVDGAKYMQEMLRINLTTQSAVYKEIRHNREALVRMMRDGATVNIDGYELAYPCYEQATAVNLKERTGSPFIPTSRRCRKRILPVILKVPLKSRFGRKLSDGTESRRICPKPRWPGWRHDEE
jgi:pimeloyl-ACP methyl ester carboxylesterase